MAQQVFEGLEDQEAQQSRRAMAEFSPLRESFTALKFDEGLVAEEGTLLRRMGLK